MAASTNLEKHGEGPPWPHLTSLALAGSCLTSKSLSAPLEEAEQTASQGEMFSLPAVSHFSRLGKLSSRWCDRESLCLKLSVPENPATAGVCTLSQS